MNLIDQDTTPKATPAIPSNRPAPSVLIACAAEAYTRIRDAQRQLAEIMGRIPDGGTTDGIRYAINDLVVAQKSIEAIQAEAAKAVR